MDLSKLTIQSSGQQIKPTFSPVDFSSLTSSVSSPAQTTPVQPSLRRKQVDLSKFLSLRQNAASPAPNFKNFMAPRPKTDTFLGNVTTPYGGTTRYERFHPGLDIANKIGTPLPAMVGGQVMETSTGHRQGEKNYGNYIIIKDNEGNLHRWSHLSNSFVKVGEKIPAGMIVGTLGNTGATYSTSRGSGSHLDYRVKNLYGKYVNPMRFVQQYQKQYART